MKFLDLLAKLGILRYGSKAAVYRSGTERPAEFLINGVFNAERDLTTAKDIAEIRKALNGRKDGGKQ
jgi:hypothetical protein